MSHLLERRKLSCISSFGFQNDQNDSQLTVLGEMFEVKKSKRPTSVPHLPRLKSGSANQKTTTEKIEESFRIACSNNDTSLVNSLLQKLKINIDSVKMCDVNENTPLHYSAGLGRKKMCRLLLENGANPNCLNKNKQTALHIAIIEEKLECVELLILFGADPYLYDSKGRLPHNYSAHLTTEIKKIFIEMEVDPKVNNIHLSSLHYMSSVGKLDFVKFLLQKGANPNRLNKFGCTPLHLAMFNGQLDSANELITNGAISNNVGAINLTPLDFYLNHIFNSINNLFYTNVYNERMKELNIKTVDELACYHLNELMKRLKNGWKFSNFETILLLINKNIDIEHQTKNIDNQVNNLETKIFKNKGKDELLKQLINYFRKLNFISRLIGHILKSERNLIQKIFLINYNIYQNDKNSIYCFLNHVLNIILNYMHHIVKYKFENKQKKRKFKL